MASDYSCYVFDSPVARAAPSPLPSPLSPPFVRGLCALLCFITTVRFCERTLESSISIVQPSAQRAHSPSSQFTGECALLTVHCSLFGAARRGAAVVIAKGRGEERRAARALERFVARSHARAQVSSSDPLFAPVRRRWCCARLELVEPNRNWNVAHRRDVTQLSFNSTCTVRLMYCSVVYVWWCRLSSVYTVVGSSSSSRVAD